MGSIILLGMPGPLEIIIIVILILLIFGGRKIPELMRGLGQGLQEFKKATKESKDKDKEKEEEKKKLEDSKE